MNVYQSDLFNKGKSIDEVQLDMAISIVQKAGYKVARTAEESKKIAIESGFKVSDPVIVNSRVINLSDLRNYFYMRLWRKYPNRRSYYFDGNIAKEIRMFRLFVESREDTGLNRYNAVQECVKIIDTIFDHDSEFNFNKPIDIRVIGQGKAGWITQKAILIMNDDTHNKREQEVKEMIDKYDEEYGVNLDEKADELDMLLSKMEANNVES